MVRIDEQILVVFGNDSTNKKSIIFIEFKLLMTHLIRDTIFHSSFKKLDKRKF